MRTGGFCVAPHPYRTGGGQERARAVGLLMDRYMRTSHSVASERGPGRRIQTHELGSFGSVG
jgi:hypothetical protein